MSTLENTAMMTYLDSKLQENVNWLFLGDLNYPNIDWVQQTSTVAQQESILAFTNENNLTQHVLTPMASYTISDTTLIPTPNFARSLFSPYASYRSETGAK